MLSKAKVNQWFIARYGGEQNLQRELKRDYFAVQYDWEIFTDSLQRDGHITETQYNNWLFPWRKEREV